MSGHKMLYDALSFVNYQQITGKIYINARERSLPRAAIISVKNGEIHDVSYMQFPADQAMSKLLTLTINTVIFTPRKNIETDRQDENRTPSIIDVLEALETILDIDVIEEEPLSSELAGDRDTLQTAAQQLLRNFYGDGISTKIGDIATHCKPHHNPKRFLNERKKFAAQFLGPDNAKKISQPLYAKTY
ncbi:MAG: hypothetical protein H6970_15790 [Gammaproteobacteria bacterium]|nr:hypothetical protein [Gammaproteobacteria bacterium]MCP5459954.1 hypothetical protein [Gammaproteobacteria bacterium]